MSRASGEDVVRERLSHYRAEPRYVLLGEPGIGKSTAFEFEATVAGTSPVTARDFARGKRPPGRAVFIDALEEYRVGEPGIDRLRTLIDALKSSDYAAWRIGCRAISLPPPDMNLLSAELGGHATLQLDLLDYSERVALLSAIGEADPAGYIERVAALGADPLLGNPATLLLLRDTFARSGVELSTRDALFAEATRQMSHESNPAMPERSDRPPPIRVEAAAEAASLVLLLSVRTDLWLYSTLPPRPSVVTRDDLIAGGIDTEALRAAADTAMFKGDAAGFQPTHRVVAEYLAGRALARAVAPEDPLTPALPVDRALAFLTGDNDRPAPALTGVYAWFVTALARTSFSAEAGKLLRLDPEAILFHGDAAALPFAQRAELLALAGRGDPWFLGAVRGSSAIGGLAGDDLVEPMRVILADAGETRHRRQMVVDALATGRRVAALAPDVRRIITTPSPDHYLRLSALDAYLRIQSEDAPLLQQLLDDIASEPPETAGELRVTVAAKMVRLRAIGAETMRRLLGAYSRTGDRVMGYGRELGAALAEHPIDGLFDEPFDIPESHGVARSFEVRSLLNRAVAAAITANVAVDARRLLRWLANIGIDDDRVEPEIQAAIAAWLDADADHERQLFDAIHAAVLGGSAHMWRVDSDFVRLTGREVSAPLREAVVREAEVADEAEIPSAAQIAFYLVQPFERNEALYWRLVSALVGRTAATRWHEALTTCEVDEWRVKRSREVKDAAARREHLGASHREWLTERIDRIRDGSLASALGFASDVYHGYRRDLASDAGGPERVAAWLNDDANLIQAVRDGWNALLTAIDTTPRAEGRATGFKRYATSELMVVAWADWRIRDQELIEPTLPLAFHMLRHAYALTGNGGRMRDAALSRIYAHPAGASALQSYWAGALSMRGGDLPHIEQLDAEQPVVREAVESFLGQRRKLGSGALSSLMNLAVQGISPERLLELAELALTRPQVPDARGIWALVAFLLSPVRHVTLLASDLSGAEGDGLFDKLWNGRFAGILQLANDTIIERSELVVVHLGARHGPSGRSSTIDRLAEVVAGMISSLAAQPTEEATLALNRLLKSPELSAWRDTIEHKLSEQLAALRAARFTPPAPRDVARALAVGPPATASDLRAVVRDALGELAIDIRNGDTSPWRHFWNRPVSGVPSPRIENDCRDILIDRLRDRLRRFGIPVNRTGTETRSASDRRSDALVLGTGAAALPIEVKRHWNKELWGAVEDQLHPYTRSAGSNGHGIYLVLWFGIARGRQLPALPDGGAKPDSPAALGELLRDRLAPEDRGRISVVVVDVSEPPPTPAQVKARARRASSGKTAKVSA